VFVCHSFYRKNILSHRGTTKEYHCFLFDSTHRTRSIGPPVCSSRCMHWQNRTYGNLPYDSNYALLRIIVSTIGFADRHQLLIQKQSQPPKRKAFLRYPQFEIVRLYAVLLRSTLFYKTSTPLHPHQDRLISLHITVWRCVHLKRPIRKATVRTVAQIHLIND